MQRTTTSNTLERLSSRLGGLLALIIISWLALTLASSPAIAQASKTPIIDPVIGTESEFPGPDEFVPSDSQPKMTHYEAPDYPTLAQRAGLHGTVWVKALVDTEGKVRDAIVGRTSGERLLDQAALDAAPSNRFEPAVFRGEAVAYWVTYKVEFDLGR